MRSIYYPILMFVLAYLLLIGDAKAETCKKSSNFRDIMKINQQLKKQPEAKVIKLKKS